MSGLLAMFSLENSYHGRPTSQSSYAHHILERRLFNRPRYSYIVADHYLATQLADQGV